MKFFLEIPKNRKLRESKFTVLQGEAASITLNRNAVHGALTKP